jgi:energy-coupling factor transport system permease protein
MLSRLHPLALLAVCLVWLVAAMLVLNAGFLAAVFCVPAFLLLTLHKVPPLRLALYCVPFLLFGLGFLSTHVLFDRQSGFATALGREALIAGEGVATGVSTGLALVMRALACGMVSIFFALTLEPGAFLRALMGQARLSPRLGFALMATLLISADLPADFARLRAARAMRQGRALSRWPGPRESAACLVPLLAGAIRRAGHVALAMESRGFVADRPRTLRDVPGFRANDAAFVAAAFGSLAGLLVLA